ncbi:hypothetical protein CKO42_22175 [Lamprobacter modestohalophilus]|uniref:Uncharacterized protein n=1 Tax=Lamprobacter modestohalophilus TaxID=1064514 RepID=A0A9X0WCT3_9GAMM|nr:hypothetical protein [Lamprobacter modestohalophilus]MBK1621079.1 hypothetical protein [Lamprobacter modestohalophilus]
MLSEKQKDDIRLATRGYAWPGGYPVYMLMGDGGVLCSTCVSREIRLIVDATRPNGSADQQWSCVAVDVNWEDPHIWSAPRCKSHLTVQQKETLRPYIRRRDEVA